MGWHGSSWMMGDGWGGPGWMMIFDGLFWLVLLALGVAGIVWLVRAARLGGLDLMSVERTYPALEILEQRYARGEINREEYLEKKEDLLGRGSAARPP
jgi:putative membrane protein